MTQKQKDILLKDLCSRLPHGVKVQCLSHQNPLKILSINPNGVTWVTGDKGYPFEVDWSDCKPYLFPLSSMTKKQKEEYEDALVYHDYVKGGWTIAKTFDDEYIIPYWFVDFCNKNHFDYRGLIPMGLANDATGLNIY